MGSSKKQTVGYKYHLGMHQILVHGPVDNMSRFTVDERVAWSGSSTGGPITVNAPELFGGEAREGGVSGAMDLEMGGPAQGPNSYLQSQLGGSAIPSFRGVVGIVMRQMYLGNNPYLKKNAFRLQRIHTRQDGVPQWYDEKAAIPSQGSFTVADYVIYDRLELIGDLHNGPPTAPGRFFPVSGLDPSGTLKIQVIGGSWSRWPDDTGNGGRAWTCGVTATGDNSVDHQFYDQVGVYPPQWYFPTGAEALANVLALPVATATGSANYRIHLNDYGVNLNRGNIFIKVSYSGSLAVMDMNPAHIIRECLTDPTWGMGYHDEDIDDDAFILAADQLYAETMGMSLLWDRQIPIEQFINEVVKHIDAALYVDRKTGKFVLKLIRGGYNLATLPEFNEDNIDKIENFNRREVSEMNNSVTVNYWDAATGKTASTTATDPALVQQQGAVINTTLQYPGFTNHATADRVALRDLRTLSTPLVSFTCYADWDGKDLNIGDVIKVTWPDYGFVALPVRITGLAFGDGVSNKIKLTCTQDVFVLPEYGVITPPDTGWEDPSQEPIPLIRQYAEEAPYYELVQQSSQTIVDTQLAAEPDLGRVAVAGSKEQSGVINAKIMTDSGAGFEDAGVMDYSPSALLDGSVPLPLGTATEVWRVKNVVEAAQVQPGSYAKVNGEYVSVVGWVTGTTLEVRRAVLDTVPHAHAADSVLFFSDPFIALDPTDYVASDEVDVKLLPVTGRGTLPVEAATAIPVILDSRAYRPYPPGNVKVNGSYWPATIGGATDLSLTWAHRDRLQQTGGALIAFTDGDVGPEVGTTYTLRIYDELGLLIREETGIAGTSYVYDQELADGGTPVAEPFWPQTVLLCPMNGVDGSTTFTDLVGHVQSGVGGNAQIDTAQFKYGGASAFFGAGYVQFPDSTDWDFGTGDFTVEMWVDFNAFPSTCTMLGNYLNSAYGWTFQRRNTNQLSFGHGDTFLIQRAWNPPNGVQQHIAVCRQGTNLRLFVDGVQQGATVTDSTNIAGSTNPLLMGALQFGGYQQHFYGWLDDVRITKAARYTANFTPPTEELSGIVYANRRNGKLTFELLSARDGYNSFQLYNYSVRRTGYGFNYGLYYGGIDANGYGYGNNHGNYYGGF